MYILLFLFWIILNGKITVEILFFGLGLTAAVGVFARVFFGYSPKSELRVLKKSPYFIAYIPVLLFEVLKANLTVMRMIPGGEDKADPVLVTFRPGLKSEFTRFLFANSITLTPGTITVEADGETFTVHCLKPELLDTSDGNVFLRLLRKMEA